MTKLKTAHFKAEKKGEDSFKFPGETFTLLKDNTMLAVYLERKSNKGKGAVYLVYVSEVGKEYIVRALSSTKGHLNAASRQSSVHYPETIEEAIKIAVSLVNKKVNKSKNPYKQVVIFSNTIEVEEKYEELIKLQPCQVSTTKVEIDKLTNISVLEEDLDRWAIVQI